MKGNVLAVLSGSATGLATILLKLYSFSQLIPVLILQGLSSLFLFRALSKEKASLVTPIVSTTSNLLTVGFGYLYLHETMNSDAVLGIFLILAGTYLISLEN